MGKRAPTRGKGQIKGMTAASENQKKFQRLLRELFQFDCADLDFGIYRIMNHKREVIEKFISEELNRAVSEELEQGILHDQDLAMEELKETAELIRETLGREALDAAGNLQQTFHALPIGNKYRKLQRRTRGARSRVTLEADIFNHLFNFFSRYYQEGDFISKRRYSRQQRYVVPYNGEEVYLHWANSDQYYIKTAERFHDYSYKAHGITVHFKLQAADVEHNNVKGDKRFFLPRTSDIAVNNDARTLSIPFEYRALDEREQERYGNANQHEAIIAELLINAPAQVEQAGDMLLALTAERHRNAEGEPVTFLEHHLRQYTRRNTSDFFIHKDLKEFLTRELDFYIKSEVLNLDDIELAGEGFAEGWFQVTKVIRTLGERIIEFLEQIEGFQKMLWEKRKFVTETQYCITLGHIDERFYPVIAACAAQWREWKELLHIDENKTDLFNSGGDLQQRRITFLCDHPSLMLDTRHFDETFKDELLASIENIDEDCSGLLVHSENFQALSFLQEKYKEKVKCIYIDPPYNSQSSEILYKNGYKHSTFLSLIANRIVLSKAFMREDTVYVIAIDENEQEKLGILLSELFPAAKKTAVTVVHNPSGQQGDNFSYCHEFAYFIYPDTKRVIELERRRNNPDIRPLRDVSQGNHLREDAANCFYPIYVRDNAVVGFGDVCPDSFHPDSANIQCDDGIIEVYPIDAQGNERKWVFARDSVEKIQHQLTVEYNKNRHIWDIIRTKTDFNYKTVWTDNKYSANSYGSKLLNEILGNPKFDFPKSIHTVKECILAAGGNLTDCVILDYFAGSGTTGHAVINLNREDGAERKFILAEMGQYFNTVLLPRIKKVTFSPVWKDGKPQRPATQEETARGPRIIKYLRLESYEDALDNIGFDEALGQQAMKLDDYLLKYMLKWETRHSATLLDIEQLTCPFAYKLNIRSNGATRETIVDVPETFNYLLGLQVQTRRVHYDEGRRYLVYRGLLEQRRASVIWRDTANWQQADLERDKQFVLEQKLTEDADEVYVNGSSFIPRATAVEPIFKKRMFA